MHLGLLFFGGAEYEMPMSIFDIAKRETARYNENAIKQTGGKSMLLAERIRNKEKLIGMYVEMTDIASAKIAGLAGYDYVWVDTEHACMSYETLLGHVIALQATGTPVVVRASRMI